MWRTLRPNPRARLIAPLQFFNPLAVWRLIESPPSDIFSQMALDRELFEEFIQTPQAVPVLRIYQVSKPSVTVGRSYQKGKGKGEQFYFLQTRLEKIEPSLFCIRPTGGGLVEHGNDLIYSVIARRDSFSTFHQVRTSYLSFHEAVQKALQKLGVETRLMRCDDNRRQRGRVTDCFSQPVATDVLFQEKKIAGGAQRRRGAAFLHQGSVQLPPGISFERLREALIEAFACQFDIAWTDKMAESVGGR